MWSSMFFASTIFVSFLLSPGACQCLCPDSEWLFEPANTTDSNKTDTIFAIQRVAEPEIIMDFRLPMNLLPVHYDLQIHPILVPDNFTFSGEVIIWVDCIEPTDQVILHATKLDVYDFEIITLERALASNVTNVTSDSLRDFIIINLDDFLQIGETYGINLRFKGLLNRLNFKGFVLSHYDIDNETRYVAVTQFEPISARTVFPCFDEPSLKATFNVTVVRACNMSSLSNMPLLESIERNDSWVADTFQKSPKMSTYTLAIAVSDFDYIEGFAGNTTIRIWVRPNAINGTELALSVIEPMISFMENYLEIPYALPKLDVIGIPNVKYGAMENWGLITFDENNLLYFETNVMDPDKHYIVTSFLAHEIAHQWFGNLVTMKWWNDIWLNEGLSTYFADILYEGVIENQVGWFEFYNSHKIFAIALTEINFFSLPVSPGPLSTTDITSNRIFSKITYIKAAILIRMMEKIGGEEILRRGLSKYMKANLFGSVEQNDLWHHISEELNASKIDGINVKEVMDTWTLQRGYPLVTVTRNYKNNTAFVRQRVYHNKRSTDNYNKDAKWVIPLMFTTKSMNRFDVDPLKWLNTNEEFVQFTSADGIPLHDEWLLFNPSLHGMYLVNYDNRNWKLLINQLISDHTKLPPVVRIHLVQTLQVLKDNDLIPHHLAYSILEYIRKEQNGNIISMASQSMFDLVRIFLPTKHFHLFQKYLRYVMQPIWKHLKSLPGSLEAYLEHVTYRLACAAGIDECLQEVTDTLLTEINNNVNDAESRNLIMNEETFCAIMRQMASDKWDELWLLKHNLTYVTFNRNSLVKSFACSENPYLIYRLLSEVVDAQRKNIQPSDRFAVFLSTINNNFFNRQLAFKILKENLLEILKWPDAQYVFHAFAKNAITQTEVEEIKSLISCIPQKYLNGKDDVYRKMLKTMEEEFETRATTISINYNWLKRATENLPLDAE